MGTEDASQPVGASLIPALQAALPCRPAAAIDGVVYIVGGTTTDGQLSSAIHSYSPSTKTWHTATASLPAGEASKALICIPAFAHQNNHGPPHANPFPLLYLWQHVSLPTWPCFALAHHLQHALMLHVLPLMASCILRAAGVPTEPSSTS